MSLKQQVALLCMLFGFVGTPASYAGDDCTKLGWHFYCDPAEETEQPPQSTPAAIQPEQDDDTPEDRLKDIQTRLDHLKAAAILEPTPENLVAYIRFQREQLDRASTFADQWRRVIWQNPDLDYDLVRPTGTLSKQAWLDQRQQQTRNTLAHLQNDYGLFYIFRGNTCPQCRVMDAAITSFQNQHPLSVMPITLDGTPSPAFPEAQANAGQAERLGVTTDTVPALILFNASKNQVVPVGFGALALDEIERRIFVLTQVEVGDDF